MIVYLSSKEASDSAKCVSPNLTDLIRDDQKMGTPMHAQAEKIADLIHIMVGRSFMQGSAMVLAI